MAPRASVRYESLDHWRGVAALAVMAFHLFATWGDSHPDARQLPWLVLIRHGWLGVELFFVISGYCIAERLARQYATGGSVSAYLLDRARRILPAYWAVLLLLLAIRLASAPFNRAAPIVPLDWLLAVPLLESWFHRPPVLTVSWTLACELFYYLLAGVCFGTARLARRPWVGFALALLLAILGLTLDPLVRQTAWQLWPHFLLGSVVWALLRFLPAPTRLLAGLLVCGGLFAFTLQPGGVAGALSLQTAAVFAFLLLLLQPWDGAIARTRFLRPLGWVGTFSFSLYLVHLPLGSPLQNLAARAWPASADRFALVPLLNCALVLAAAWLFYRKVEQPLEAWRRRLAGRPTAFPSP
jgi:exopolysaccharide production protein ExoZ